MKSHIKPLLYALGDSLEMDITATDFNIEGTRKSVYELFETYSPTVVAKITDSLVDTHNGIVAAVVQVWGNLKVLIVVEEKYNTLSLFVFDRAKAPEAKPFDTFWTRKGVYAWLNESCQAVYHRSLVYQSDWDVLENGPAKLRDYNTARAAGEGAGDAYREMWADA